jgi:hypothetical protein
MFSEMANKHAKSHNRAGTLSDVSTPWRLNLMTERCRDVLVEEKLSRDGGGEDLKSSASLSTLTLMYRETQHKVKLYPKF